MKNLKMLYNHIKRPNFNLGDLGRKIETQENQIFFLQKIKRKDFFWGGRAHTRCSLNRYSVNAPQAAEGGEVGTVGVGAGGGEAYSSISKSY